MNAPGFLDSDEEQFSSALHERLQSESPDLERILVGATRDGRRRRLRRRVGIGVAGVACVGLAATAYAVIPGAGDEPAHEGQVASGGGHDDVVTQDEPTAKHSAKKPARNPGPGLRDKAPVALHLKGWTCEYFPVDDKAWCPGPGEIPGGYVVRPAKERDAFLGKSGGRGSTIPMLGGKGIVATDGTIIGPVHNGIFLTVQSGIGFTPELMAEFAQALSWTE